MTLEWNANPEGEGVVGYRIYSRAEGGSYGPAVSVGNVTSVVFGNPGTPRYYAVTAVNGSGGESEPSDEFFK